MHFKSATKHAKHLNLFYCNLKILLQTKRIQITSKAFYFRSERKMVKAFLDDMVYIESLKDYISIHRFDDKLLVLKQSISTIEAILPHHLLLRIHRSFIISINRAFTPHDVEIENIEIPIGRIVQFESKKIVVNWYGSKHGILRSTTNLLSKNLIL